MYVLDIEKELTDGEVVEDLQCDGLKLVQRAGMYKFGLDSVLLANFTHAPTGSTIVELCAGSGVVSILLSSKTAASRIIGIEILDDFVKMAEKSIAINDLVGRVEMIHGDIKDVPQLFQKGDAGAVVVNPPYMKQNSGFRNNNTQMTIARHETMCSLRDVVKAASYLLPTGGAFFMVHRPQRLVDAFCLMREYDIEPKYIMLVCPRQGQRPTMVLIEGRKSRGAELIFLEQLYVYDESGRYISQDRLEQLRKR